MATVINNPAEAREVREVRTEDSGAGWMVAAIVIIALVLLAAFVWPRFVQQSAIPAQTPGASVNVSLPSAPSTNNTSGSGNTGAGTTNTPTNSTQPTQ